MNDEPIDRFLAVGDGLKLHVRDYGGNDERAPLLCLHGLTRNARDFTAFAESHSPQRRVIVVEFRGRGSSDRDPEPQRYNPLTYARDIIEVLDQLTVPRATFVGTSLGGLVTMILAAMAPDRVAAAILNDVGPELDAAGLERIRTYVGRDPSFASWEDAASALRATQADAHPGYAAADWLAMALRLCRDEGGVIRFDYDPAIAVPFQAPPPETPFDWWPMFRALAAKPLLVIRGELSDLFSAQALERMQAEAPQMQLVTVPGVGHAPMLDEPEAEAAIDAFLEGLQE